MLEGDEIANRALVQINERACNWGSQKCLELHTRILFDGWVDGRKLYKSEAQHQKVDRPKPSGPLSSLRSLPPSSIGCCMLR